jgi:hypothetical protein
MDISNKNFPNYALVGVHKIIIITTYVQITQLSNCVGSAAEADPNFVYLDWSRSRKKWHMQPHKTVTNWPISVVTWFSF